MTYSIATKININAGRFERYSLNQIPVAVFCSQRSKLVLGSKYLPFAFYTRASQHGRNMINA